MMSDVGVDIGAKTVARLKEQLRRASVAPDEYQEWEFADESEVRALEAELEAHDELQRATLQAELQAEHKQAGTTLLGDLRAKLQGMRETTKQMLEDSVTNDGTGGGENKIDMGHATVAGEETMGAGHDNGESGTDGAATAATMSPDLKRSVRGESSMYELEKELIQQLRAVRERKAAIMREYADARAKPTQYTTGTIKPSRLRTKACADDEARTRKRINEVKPVVNERAELVQLGKARHAQCRARAVAVQAARAAQIAANTAGAVSKLTMLECVRAEDAHDARHPDLPRALSKSKTQATICPADLLGLKTLLMDQQLKGSRHFSQMPTSALPTLPGPARATSQAPVQALIQASTRATVSEQVLSQASPQPVAQAQADTLAHEPGHSSPQALVQSSVQATVQSQAAIQAPAQTIVHVQAERQGSGAQTRVTVPVNEAVPEQSAVPTSPTSRQSRRTVELQQLPRDSRDAAMLFHVQSCKRWALSGDQNTNLTNARAKSSPARRQRRDPNVLVGTNIHRTGLVLKQAKSASNTVSALSPKARMKLRDHAARRPRLLSSELALRSLFTSEAQDGPAALHAARWHKIG